MTILNREQIDATYPGPLRDTALAYHDLRDAVLALCDAPDGAFMAAYVLVPRIREVVARVERAPEGEAMTDPDRNAGRADARAFLALLAVRALHFGEYDEHSDGNRCAECLAEYPCPTIRALDGRAVARVERGVTTKRERLRPEGSPALGATYRDWRDFTDRVARPLVENDGDDDRIEKWHRVLMMEADDYYLAVALVMADNRIRELEAVARSYHDLRDAMLRLHHHDGRHGCATCIDPDGFPAPWPCETFEVVARVERGGHDPVS